MPASLITSNTYAFADGNAGHSCDLGSAPAVDDVDVLCVNSDTIVATPAGFTAGESAVANQGAYIFYRKAVGGEASTVTITTTGNFNCCVIWSRWDNVNAIDTSTSTQVNGSAGASTPAHNTGALAETNELSVAFGALHSIGDAGQTSPSWSAGYTGLTTVAQGTGGTGCRGYVGYKTTAGTAAETPQVSWSGTNAEDRYMVVLTFTSAGISATIGTATETDTALALVASKSRDLGIPVETDTALPFGREKSLAIGPALEFSEALPLTVRQGQRYFTPPSIREGMDTRHGLWRYYSWDVGRTFLVSGATVTVVQHPWQGDLGSYDYVYQGGYKHPITAAEATTLTNAGYGAYITIE